ncbi:MAG: phosphate acyltransferase PlsX [Rhabdochlamydiaceae bacterium]|nr:phosphate acyltransferase PlsX [Rhabdochlamydiaceae bacterium]
MQGKNNRFPSQEATSNTKGCPIGVDLLGSDTPPEDLLQEIIPFAKTLPAHVTLHIFGTHGLFLGHLSSPPHLIFHEVSEVISMEDDPLKALRLKKNSSICTGIKMLKEGTLNAFVSAGNTGALMACAKLQLPMLPGMARPALLTLLPTREHDIAVLDVGANTSFKAEHLLQFAAMGIAYQKNRGIDTPKVGLLNIGAEAQKGTPELREAHSLLSTLDAFVGNIEARDVFQGKIHVLVTDGFTGNIFLKTAEGIAAVILDQLEEIAQEECSPHLKGVLAEMRHRLHYAEYPGALLCGVDGLVMKCHGNSSPQSMKHTITSAIRLVDHGFLERTKQQLLS